MEEAYRRLAVNVESVSSLETVVKAGGVFRWHEKKTVPIETMDTTTCHVDHKIRRKHD